MATLSKRERFNQARALSKSIMALPLPGQLGWRKRWEWTLDEMRQSISPNEQSAQSVYKMPARRVIAHAIRAGAAVLGNGPQIVVNVNDQVARDAHAAMVAAAVEYRMVK